MAVDIEPVQAPIQDAKSHSTTQPQDKATNGAPRKPRRQRPNFNEIHAKPIPLEVYPLPAFIPHNPISIVRIAISLISHSIFPPKSHQVVHRAYFSPQTQSIHVTDAAAIRALWEQGFWGKGSLSRSEPQWLAGEKKRRGVEETKTSAEVTQSRREERRQFKLERARAQREAIEQQLRQEGKLDADASVEELVDDGQMEESPKGTLYGSENGDAITLTGDAITSVISKTLAEAEPTWEQKDAAAIEEVVIKDEEHLQLTPEEAFYLTYSLGALSIVADGNSQIYPAWYLFRLYAGNANTPVDEDKLRHLQLAFQSHELQGAIYPTMSSVPRIEPDNTFVLQYVVFHHFRSLGWVVRPGIKFAVDYLLYLRGPAFHHAEFAIMIIPSYSDPYWTDAPEHVSNSEKRKQELAKKDWWWLHRVNRVQTAVFKTLVLVYVEVPPPWDGEGEGVQDGWKVDVGSALKKYTVREVLLRRWSPNRNRD